MKKSKHILIFISISTMLLMSGCVQKNNPQQENISSNEYEVQKDENNNETNELLESNKTQTVDFNGYKITLSDNVEVSSNQDNSIILNSDEFQAVMVIEPGDEYIYIGQGELYQYLQLKNGESGIVDVSIKTRNDEDYVYVELEENEIIIDKYIDNNKITIIGNYINKDSKTEGDKVLMQIIDGMQSKNKPSEMETTHNVVGDATITIPAKYAQIDTDDYINQDQLTFKRKGVGVITVDKHAKYSTIEEAGKNTAASFMSEDFGMFDKILRDEVINMPYGDIYYGEYIDNESENALILGILNYRDTTIKINGVPEKDLSKNVTKSLEILRSDIETILDSIYLGM